MKDIVIQGIGILAMAMNVLSYQRKDQRSLILMQLVGSMLFAVNLLALGAISGGLLNIVGVLRAVVFSNKRTFHAEKKAWVVGFIAAYLVMYALTFAAFGKAATAANLVVEFLPVIGMIATTISFYMSEARDARRLGLINSPMWLIYNLISGSIGGILCEVFDLLSIFLGMYRLDRRKK